MVNTKAAEIVKKAENEGLTHREIARICGIKPASIYRWKKSGRAKANVIRKLEKYLETGGRAFDGELVTDKPLSEATIEDLSRRARELGFRASFTDIS